MKLTLLAALLVLGIGVGILMRARRASRVSHERDGLTQFRETYGGRYPDALLQGTYTYLAERDATASPHYMVSPTDNLQNVYGLADLDLEDAVLVIADKAGARLPSVQDLDGLKASVRTVDDMLRFLNPYFRNEAVQG